MIGGTGGYTDRGGRTLAVGPGRPRGCRLPLAGRRIDQLAHPLIRGRGIEVTQVDRAGHRARRGAEPPAGGARLAHQLVDDAADVAAGIRLRPQPDQVVDIEGHRDSALWHATANRQGHRSRAPVRLRRHPSIR